jgi:hypothetical protein
MTMRSPIFTALLAVAFLLPSTRVAAAQNGVAAHYSIPIPWYNHVMERVSVWKDPSVPVDASSKSPGESGRFTFTNDVKDANASYATEQPTPKSCEDCSCGSDGVAKLAGDAAGTKLQPMSTVLPQDLLVGDTGSPTAFSFALIATEWSHRASSLSTLHLLCAHLNQSNTLTGHPTTTESSLSIRSKRSRNLFLRNIQTEPFHANLESQRELSPQLGTVEVGVASRYNKGVMEKVARVRRMVQPAGTCMIARLTRADLGRWYRVQNRITGKVRICIVIDYAHPRDKATIARKGIVAELRYEDAAYICGSTRDPPRQCPVRVKLL